MLKSFLNLMVTVFSVYSLLGLVILIGHKTRVVFIGEDFVFKLKYDILLDECRQDLDVKLLA